jgi:nucleoside-diphosphate-sugar epimerase
VTGVVHLAAIPAPGQATNHVTFTVNTVSTYNIFEAARQLGIKNVVWASSETVLGLPFDTPPPYAPIDEEYAPRPESTYSLVKTLEEEMARQFCRWDPELKMLGLRFSNVMAPADYASFEGFQQDPLLRKWNLWGYIDGRDGAQAVRLALESSLVGTEVFIVANADTVMRRDSADLLAEVFPDVPLRRPVVGRETLLSIDKARRVLGYGPQHGWQNSREA